MTKHLSREDGSMSRLMTRRIVVLALLSGHSLVTVSGCRRSDGGDSSGTAPTVESRGSEGPVAPDHGSDEPRESDPEPSTDPCAFEGDPLCPHSTIKVPPPSISNWP